MIQEKVENQQEEEVREETCFTEISVEERNTEGSMGSFQRFSEHSPKWKDGQVLNIELKPNTAIIDTLQDNQKYKTLSMEFVLHFCQ